MSQTEALTRVMTHVASEMLDFCRCQSMTREQTLRVVEQTLNNTTVREWVACQAMRMAPAA